MSTWTAIASAIAAATGRPFSVERRSAVRGGCINQAFRVDGISRSFFVKTGGAESVAMFAAEHAALDEIRRTGAVRVPRPVCHGVDADTSWLALEFVRFAPAPPAGMRRLGAALARLHRTTADFFGWDRDAAIGATPQINTRCRDWAAFWRDNRLGYQLDLAARNGYTGALRRGGEQLLERLPALFAGYSPRPSLLHGDLWSANAAFDESGAPVIFDPALYYGDREADIAMTELFGGFSGDFYAGYREAFPLEPGYALRRDLYNLYHVLNHLNLFGAGYRPQAEDLIARLLAAG